MVFSYIGFRLTKLYPMVVSHSGKGTLQLKIQEENIDRILLSIIGILIVLVGTLAIYMLLGENWAIGIMVVLSTPFGYWFYDNWLKH